MASLITTKGSDMSIAFVAALSSLVIVIVMWKLWYWKVKYQAYQCAKLHIDSNIHYHRGIKVTPRQREQLIKSCAEAILTSNTQTYDSLYQDIFSGEE
jgi:hypothetical protein